MASSVVTSHSSRISAKSRPAHSGCGFDQVTSTRSEDATDAAMSTVELAM